MNVLKQDGGAIRQ